MWQSTIVLDSEVKMLNVKRVLILSLLLFTVLPLVAMPLVALVLPLIQVAFASTGNGPPGPWRQ